MTELSEKLTNQLEFEGDTMKYQRDAELYLRMYPELKNELTNVRSAIQKDINLICPNASAGRDEYTGVAEPRFD